MKRTNLVFLCLSVLLFSGCFDKSVTEYDNNSNKFKDKQNRIQSFSPPNVVDSILCADTLLPLALLELNSAFNPIIDLIENNIEFDPTDGYRHYSITVRFQDSSTKRLIFDYWDTGNAQSLATGTAYWCEGADCCRVGTKVNTYDGKKDKVCFCNGSISYSCILRSKEVEIDKSITGEIILSSLNYIESLSIINL